MIFERSIKKKDFLQFKDLIIAGIFTVNKPLKTLIEMLCGLSQLLNYTSDHIIFFE